MEKNLPIIDENNSIFHLFFSISRFFFVAFYDSHCGQWTKCSSCIHCLLIQFKSPVDLSTFQVLRYERICNKCNQFKPLKNALALCIQCKYFSWTECKYLRKYFSWKKNWNTERSYFAYIGHQRVQLVHWFVATNPLCIYSDSRNLNIMCLRNLHLYACLTHTSKSKDVCGWISIVYALKMTDHSNFSDIQSMNPSENILLQSVFFFNHIDKIWIVSQ